MKIILIGLAIFMTLSTNGEAAEPTPENFEINTQMMEATFRITGPSKQQIGATAGGTVFVMGKPLAADPSRAAFVMVTAAHVFDEIIGDKARIDFRYKGADGKYVEFQHEIALRDAGSARYVKHPEVDVAAIYVEMPTQFQTVKLLNIGLLGSDDWLKQFEIHPGDELFCLGFPLFASADHGFPILRSGKIASYPLIPSREHKNWFFDFRVFQGNSGGPVYFVDRGRSYGGTTHVGQTIQFLVGLVTSQAFAPLVGNRDLQLGIVIPSIFIKETLDMLPEISP